MAWPWDDPVFEIGDKVKCLNSSGYPQLREGETYEVLKYEERDPSQHFTWPAYVAVKIDDERSAFCHASRFIKE